jgi:sulfate transport system substrate-binding protein
VVSFPIRSLGRTTAGLALAGLATTPIAASLTLTGASLLVAQPARADSNEILLVSYAVTKAAYDRIIPLFVADYKKRTGETVRSRPAMAAPAARPAP